MDIKKKIQLQRWWMEKLREMTRKVMKEEEGRQEKIRKKFTAFLSDYSSRDEIIEAYGFGTITEWKRDKLLDMWDSSSQGASELYDAKIALLQDAYEEAQRILRELGASD